MNRKQRTLLLLIIFWASSSARPVLVLARGSAGAIEQATNRAIKREDTPAALLALAQEPKQIPEMSRACRYGKWYGIWCGDGRQWLPMGLQRYSSQ